MKIPIEELRLFNDSLYFYNNVGESYRIVYINSNDTYYVGAFSKDIEEFMYNFATKELIEDESDIPEFIFNDDLLTRYLNRLTDIKEAAIYRTTGECIAIKYRNKNILK